MRAIPPAITSTAPTATEALPGLTRGRDRKRGSLLVVERAQTLETRTGLAQRDRLADEVGQVDL